LITLLKRYINNQHDARNEVGDYNHGKEAHFFLK